MPDIAVVHLVWIPLGLEPFENFLASYRRYLDDLPHDLILLFNGQHTRDQIAPFEECVRDIPHQSFVVDTPQQDIASYFAVVEANHHRFFCFLNSYSELQAPQWLTKLHQHLATPGVGLVGATGSWESMKIIVPIRNLRTWLFSRYHNPHFPAFPNPHIRSTGFMLARDTMLGMQRWPIVKKKDAYRFENGFQSMTRQIQGRGLRALVVDKDGQAYDPPEWAGTRTFRSGDQSQLLITDNRTAIYANGDATLRRTMARMAWGESALPVADDTV